MNRPQEPSGRPDAGPPARPELYFIPHRPGRIDRRFLPPALILLAVAGLVTYRILTPDWHRDLAAQRGPKPTSPAPAPDSRSGPVAVRPAAPKVGPDAVAQAARDDIRRAAERERARREEIERFKEEEGRRLAAEERRNPPPDPRIGHLDPADRGRQFRAWADQQQEAHRRRFEAMVRDQQEFQRRQMEAMFDRQRGFLMPLQPQPLPGLPGQPDARSFSMTTPPGGGIRFEMHWESRSVGP